MLIESSRVCLLVVDIQESITKNVLKRDLILFNIKTLLDGVSLFGIQSIFSLQKPEKLGGIPADFKNYIKNNVFEKTSFSCTDSNFLLDAIKLNNIDSIIVIGVETHICILQTCIGLKDMGINVYPVVDALSCRNDLDHKIAIGRLKKIGCELTTTESLLFELCQDSNSKEFKSLSKIIKDRSAVILNSQ